MIHHLSATPFKCDEFSYIPRSFSYCTLAVQKAFKGAVPDGSNKVIDFSSDWLQIGSILGVVWKIFLLCEVLTFFLVDKK